MLKALIIKLMDENKYYSANKVLKLGILPQYTSRTGLNYFLKKNADQYNVIVRMGPHVDSKDGREWQSVRYLIKGSDLKRLKHDIENGKI